MTKIAAVCFLTTRSRPVEPGKHISVTSGTQIAGGLTAMAKRQPTRPLVVAVFNTSPDLIDVVRRAFEPAGIVVISLLTYQIREGGVDLEEFLTHNNPDVVVYDIAPPYDANWNLFQHIRRLLGMRKRKVVLTSINRAQRVNRREARRQGRQNLRNRR